MASSDQHQRGEMDIAEQVSTFEFFNGMTKWGSLFVATLLTFLVLWFCTGAGFLGAFVAAAVLVGGGIFFLRDKPEAAAH